VLKNEHFAYDSQEEHYLHMCWKKHFAYESQEEHYLHMRWKMSTCL